MRVVCAGMRRAGSTWLYNVARLLCAQAGRTHGCFEDQYSCDTADIYEHEVIKTHKFNLGMCFGADAVLTCYRDLRDVAASAVRRKFVTPDPLAVIRYLIRTVHDEHGAWSDHARVDVKYENMKERPLRAARNVMLALKLKVDYVAVAAKVAKLPVPLTQTDPELLLHPGHITDGRHGTWHNVLPEHTICSIETLFEDWLQERGY